MVREGGGRGERGGRGESGGGGKGREGGWVEEGERGREGGGRGEREGGVGEGERGRKEELFSRSLGHSQHRKPPSYRNLGNCGAVLGLP